MHIKRFGTPPASIVRIIFKKHHGCTNIYIILYLFLFSYRSSVFIDRRVYEYY